MEDFRTGTGNLGWRLGTEQYTKQRGREAKRRRKGISDQISAIRRQEEEVEELKVERKR
jgi:hypothetical protein